MMFAMPTLSQEISWSLWEPRAWTFQEGLLSPQRLFFTNHQVYFQCGSVQCCESLDDSHSPFHLPSDEEWRVALNAMVEDRGTTGPGGGIGRGILRDSFRPISGAGEAQVDHDDFAKSLSLIRSYTTKNMSRDVHSFHASSAVFMRLV